MSLAVVTLARAIIAILLWPSFAVFAANYQPKSDDEVLFVIPKGLTPSSAPVTADIGQSDPEGTEIVVAELLAQARKSGDPRLYGQAQAKLTPWWKDKELSGRLLLHRANIKQFNHQFQPALVDLRKFLQKDPLDLKGQLMLMSVHLVLGQFEDAARACQAIGQINVMIQKICTAGVLSQSGKSDEALTILQPLEGLIEIRFRAVLPYFVWTMADAYARQGRLDDAVKYYGIGLELSPNERFALAALADLWFDKNESQKTLIALKEQTQHDGLLVRLAIAQRRGGDPGLASSVAELKARFEREGLRGASRHDREGALFQLHVLGNGKEALQLAKANWEVQRETTDVRIYLDAAVAEKSETDLKDIVNWMKKSGYRDATCTSILKKAGFEF